MPTNWKRERVMPNNDGVIPFIRFPCVGGTAKERQRATGNIYGSIIRLHLIHHMHSVHDNVPTVYLQSVRTVVVLLASWSSWKSWYSGLVDGSCTRRRGTRSPATVDELVPGVVEDVVVHAILSTNHGGGDGARGDVSTGSRARQQQAATTVNTRATTRQQATLAGSSG